MSAERRTDDGAECRSRRHVRLAAVAVAAGLLLESGAAGAGDRYVRGGLGVDWSGNTAFTDVDCSSTSPCGALRVRNGRRRRAPPVGGRFRDGACGRARARLRDGTGAFRGAGRIPPALCIQGPGQLPGAGDPGGGQGKAVVGFRDAGRLRGPRRYGPAKAGPVRAVRRHRHRGGPYPDRKDDHDVSGDDDDRAGRKAGRVWPGW